MSLESNKNLARRYHMDIFQVNKLEIVDEIIDKDFKLHNPGRPSDMNPLWGPEGVK